MRKEKKKRAENERRGLQTLFQGGMRRKQHNVEIYSVAIGNPERHMRKASSHAMITLRVRYCYVQSLTSLVSPEITRHDHSIIACSRHIYVWCCSSRTSRSC